MDDILQMLGWFVLIAILIVIALKVLDVLGSVLIGLTSSTLGLIFVFIVVILLIKKL